MVWMAPGDSVRGGGFLSSKELSQYVTTPYNTKRDTKAPQVFIALFAFFILPDLPRTTSWLSEDEKDLAAWRLEEDIGQDDWVDSKQQTFLHGAKLAAKDPKAWLLLATIYGFTSAGTVTTLFPSVIKGLGKDDITTLLLTTPPYLIAVVAILCNAWHADASGERYLHIAIPPVIAFIAFAIAAGTTKFGPRYFAMCVMVGANYSGYVVALSWISNGMLMHELCS